VPTDNEFVYTHARRFRAGSLPSARQIGIPSYTPRWNGKVETFITTLQQE
jgi:hypothetical protein